MGNKEKNVFSFSGQKVWQSCRTHDVGEMFALPSVRLTFDTLRRNYCLGKLERG